MGRFFNFWELSERERKGYVLLLMLILLILVAPWAYRHFFISRPVEQPSLALLDSLVLSNTDGAKYPPKVHDYSNFNTATEPYSKKTKVPLFYFNPNQLPEEQWLALGFSTKQVQVIKNYERKGGRFRSKADLAKIYAISDAQFQRISPYLLFDTAIVKKSTSSVSGNASYATKPKTLLIDLNRADTSELKKLYGIGSAFSKRIVNFRERLGGYSSVEQLADIYGLSPELLAAIRPQLYIDSSFPMQQIPFRTATVADLMRHPYINQKIATLLLRYRDQHAPIKGITDLENILALPEGFLRKIEPYLSFN